MTSEITNKDYSALIANIKDDIEKRLRELISDYLDNAEVALLNTARQNPGNVQLDRHECLINLKMNKSDIAVSYIMSVKALLRPFPITEAEKRRHKPVDEDELSLSLVDHSEIEDMVLVKNIGERVSDNFREQISNLEARLEYLALITDDIFQKRAISPTNLCQAFDDALGDNFDSPCKKFLFAFFYDAVASKFIGIYDATNNMLVDAGILPQIKIKKLNKPRSKHRVLSNTDLPDSASNDVSADNLQKASHAQQAATGSTGNEDTIQPGDIGSGYARTAAPGQPRSRSKASIPTDQISQALDNFLGMLSQRRSAGSGTAEENPNFPTGTPQTFGHDEILSALSSVQSSPQFDQPSELRFDADAVKNAIINEIAKKSGGIVTKRINELATKTIDFIELIFDAIIEDEAISDTIKTLLLRLQIPIIKASMLDPEFFIQDTHPARVLLDRIAEVGFGVTNHEDETYIELDNVVSIILDEFELNTSTFQNALDRLNKYVETMEALAREKEEAAQKQVLREHARNTVLKALRTITAGKTLPESVHPLVLKRWPTLMFNHYLTNGKDNDQWVTIIEALREIVASVQSITTADELAYLQHHQDAILTRTRHFLKATNRSSQDIESVLDGLKSAQDNLIAKTNFAAEEIISASQKLIGDERAAQEEPRSDTRDLATSENAAPAPRLPSNIIPGMWFRIYMGEDKPPRRAKLSVIIMEDSKLVFVNHNGDIIVEKTFDEFTNEIEKGKSNMIMGHSIFDHALSSVIGKLQQ